ncbi:MAG: sensor histidine kinase [Sphingomonadaceae bacterium]
MAPPIEKSPDLAALLGRHRQQIARSWAQRVHQLPDSHYRQRPLEELRVAGSRCVDAILEALATGSYAAIDHYLLDVSLARLRQRFDISEVIEGLLLWRETALPYVLDAFSSSWSEACKTIAQLDACVRHLIARFGHLYAEAMHRDMEAQEERLAVMEERQRLARELHDSVTQSLYSTTLYAEAAAELLRAGQTEKAMDRLRELRETAQEALREMRLLIFELLPPVLEKDGLVAALQARLEAVEVRGGLQADLRVEGAGRLPPALERELYRIAQEALNNVLKHARARHVTVLLRLGEGSVCLEVKDDGVGFDPEAVWDRGGLGLKGMRERAQRLGGEFRVDSAPGGGCRVSVELLPRAVAEREV